MNEDYDYCYECTGYGDDYYYDEETNDVIAWMKPPKPYKEGGAGKNEVY